MIKVYLITNKINNKKYIGITKNSIEIRWKVHCSKNSYCTYLKNAIQKYGKENFIIEQIFEVFNKEDVVFFESYFITYFNTMEPIGYNLIKSRYNLGFSKYISDKISESNIHNWKYNNGYREKLMKERKERWTLERKQKYSEYMKQRHLKGDVSLRKGVDKYIEEKKKPIIGVSIYDGSILRFHTITESYNHNFYPEACLKGQDKYSNGYSWFYNNGEPDEIFINNTLELLGGKFKADIRNGIKSIDKKTGEIKVYKSLKDIELEAKHDIIAIQTVLRGVRKTYHGKFWLPNNE
jgi:group I intron endonuclease